jgi:prefoldin subunit 5
MNKFAKIDGHQNLIRDIKSNAIINTDISEGNNYLQNREKRKEDQETMQKLKNDIDSLKSSIDEIKFLIKGIKNESQ